ncbi:hypothetical protein MtrunA17_Chr8g0382461 [Medicago truncatula]|uniref:Transmembrane protein, putative n=1 Tax=Medicago truncatula TaxID=3880 RepID=A0A072TVJ1_MEDTR|nr:transmembrane protein, putative [Medicago truncatula]RHN42943.1 hypothetical protein MtrunA17_Chr8g0382461 [Medicago truncatula]
MTWWCVESCFSAPPSLPPSSGVSFVTVLKCLRSSLFWCLIQVLTSVIFLRHPDPPLIGWLGVGALYVGFVGARWRSGWLFCAAYWLGAAGLLLFVLGLLVPSVLFLLSLFYTVGARCCCCVVATTWWHFLCGLCI